MIDRAQEFPSQFTWQRQPSGAVASPVRTMSWFDPSHLPLKPTKTPPAAAGGCTADILVGSGVVLR